MATIMEYEVKIALVVESDQAYENRYFEVTIDGMRLGQGDTIEEAIRYSQSVGKVDVRSLEEKIGG